MNIQSGRGLKGSKSNNSSKKMAKGSNSSNSEDAKYLSEDSEGRTVLNLDKIVMEEASRNYWRNFSEQIGNGEHSLLFQLLSELLERLKALSPPNQHSHLDDLMDVEFIQ